LQDAEAFGILERYAHPYKRLSAIRGRPLQSGSEPLPQPFNAAVHCLMISTQATPRTVSFVIRTYNEAAFIGRLLDVLAQQKDAPAGAEIIVVDSASTDATTDIAKSKGAALLHIKKEEFDYSKALNRGIEKASGEFIVILSAHSIPRDSDWLRSMLAHFGTANVAGVYSRQVAWPDAQWWEVRRVGKEFGDAPAVFEMKNNSPAVSFSNAASCIRRAVWEKRPFMLATGEDAEWATWAVSQGFKIVYEPRVAVFHSHHESCRQAMRRVIEFEKVGDQRLGRSRTALLTLKQAIGRTVRDLRDVLKLQNSQHSRLRLTWESLVRGYWFLRDFHPDARFRSPVR
jgi:hypothetical protein